MVGREIALGGRPSTVIGIVPAGFQIDPPFTAGSVATGDPTALWVLAGEAGSPAAQAAHYVHVIARLKPGVTLAAASSIEPALKGQIKTGADKAAAGAVGKLIAERAKAAGVEKVVFDRGSYIFHGRVKALADAAREGGLGF